MRDDMEGELLACGACIMAAGGCLLPLPVVDMSNGADVPADGGILRALACGPIIAGGAADDAVAAGGIENDMPSSAAIGCHGLRADLRSSRPVILAFRNDLKMVRKYTHVGLVSIPKICHSIINYKTGIVP